MIKKTKKIFRDYINNRYPDWDITIALRYLPIVDDLKKNHKNGETILEVGSEITGITPYLKKKVVGLDTNFDYSRKNQYLSPVKGSVIKLPFEDKSFDFVLSVDMLEHIPDNLRVKAVKELIRVCRKKLYLTFPCGKYSEEVDKRIRQYYLKVRGEDYPYLKEHVELGLPNEKEVYNLLKEAKPNKLKVYPNTSIWIWEILLKWGLSGDRLKSSLYRRSLLILPLLKYFNFGQTYRKLLVAEFL